MSSGIESIGPPSSSIPSSIPTSISTSLPSSVPPAHSSITPTTRESSITVAVRVRPFTESEEINLIKHDNDTFFLGDGSLSSNVSDTPSKKSLFSPRGIRNILDVADDKMLIFDPPETNPLNTMQRNAFPNGVNGSSSRIKEHRFVFDRLFDMSASQTDVYHHTTRPLLDSILDGFNATVFAYGATGCGKTHTISGKLDDPGVIFLTMKELYQRIDDLNDSKIIDISLSYLEIYNETIRDLLNPQIDHKKLILREDSQKRISVSNLSIHKPHNVEEVMEMILRGNENRTISPTEANATSSRSHAVLQINVIQKNRTADLNEEHTFATLSIIDLAGSERAAATKNRGIRLNEGANINKSLLALGNCINALCDPRRRNHVPYRDSKLTRLLKFSLGGNCKTVMIVCVSPSSQHYDETLNTLKYANRAKEIKTKLIRNLHNLDRHVGSYLKMITEQKQEIIELRLRESKIESSIIQKQKLINEKCLHVLLENIEIIKTSLNKHQNEKWKKYFILAKRKLLISQRIQIEILLSGFNNINLSLANLCEQVLVKIDQQIPELESQYGKSDDIDYIFNETSNQILNRLKEYEGWSDYYSLIFQKFLDSLHESFDREILFNSSILFDHLIYKLKDYSFIPKELTRAINNEDSNSIETHILSSLEDLVNGEFDSAIEKYTTEFMQQKLKDQQDDDLQNTPLPNDYHDNHNNNNEKLIHNVPNLSKPREGKRAPLSPLRASPPRNFKRSISKKPITPKFSPHRSKASKKVRWDIPRSDTSILTQDQEPGEVTMDDEEEDEQVNNTSTLKSDFEDDSPLTNTILNSSLLNDDLDDDEGNNTTMESPPLLSSSKINPNGSLNDIKPRARIFSNRRLSINLNDHQPSSSSKLPLLNKGASIKLQDTNNILDDLHPPSLISNSLPTSPKKLIISGTPTNVINHFPVIESRIGVNSQGSDKVD
ncbi:P-loop containing nucleoside triphosphate hydrolase protein [Scheffersomyces coipomensis]|uniref:P-loop containing nucleoside triphosphate hydrolase protein n=1 Tax=Scheffersomyces coipomensis TaxID=1788519 RepID=UPI00315D97FF